MKKIIAVILGVVGILSAGAAEALAIPLVVEQGGFFNSVGFFEIMNGAAFSGNNFAVSIFAVGTGVGGFEQVFTTGIYDVAFERGSHFLGGRIQVADVSCESHPDPDGPACSGNLRLINQPLPFVAEFPPVPHEAPFTMTGQLVLGRLGLPDLIFDIEGSGIVTGVVESGVLPPPFPPITVTNYRVTHQFAAVPEPSTVILVLSGLVAVGGRRWRGGKHLLCLLHHDVLRVMI
jgi:hypothetical protein